MVYLTRLTTLWLMTCMLRCLLRVSLLANRWVLYHIILKNQGKSKKKSVTRHAQEVVGQTHSLRLR